VSPSADDAMEREVGRWLKAGVLLAAAVVLAGGVAYLIGSGGTPFALQAFRGEPAELRSLAGIVGGAVALDSRAVIQLGVVLLIATPIVRVALTLAGFLRQRDRQYVALTTLVLGLLLFSLLHGTG
jgi:uncharacterized membrane protein